MSPPESEGSARPRDTAGAPLIKNALLAGPRDRRPITEQGAHRRTGPQTRREPLVSPQEARPPAGNLDQAQDALASAIQRSAIQDLAVQIIGWGHLAARAAEVSSATELLGVLRGARKPLVAALEMTKELVAIEDGGGAS